MRASRVVLGLMVCPLLLLPTLAIACAEPDLEMEAAQKAADDRAKASAAASPLPTETPEDRDEMAEYYTVAPGMKVFSTNWEGYDNYIVKFSGDNPPYHGFALMDAAPIIHWHADGHDDVYALGTARVDETGEIQVHSKDRYEMNASITSGGAFSGTVTWTLKGKLVNTSINFVNPMDYVASGTVKGQITDPGGGAKKTISGTMTGNTHYECEDASHQPLVTDKAFTWSFTGTQR